jgi:integrase
MAAHNGAKGRLEAFKQLPPVRQWVDGSTIKASTMALYVKYLMDFLNGQDPKDFLAMCEKDPRSVTMDVKARLGTIYRSSTSKANQTAYAVRHFLDYYEVEGVNIKTKALKIKRKRQKNVLPWQEAERILTEADQPYRAIYDFMRWSGLGQDEVDEIQRTPRIQQAIEAQRSNDKPYVRIDLSPRKSNVDMFYTLVPKAHVPAFPLQTHVIGPRGGGLVSPYDLRENWRRAAKKAGLWHEGLGCHTLMSTFESTCGMAGVPDGVIALCRGHGSADRYGYRRETQTEAFVAEQLAKFWSFNQPATKGELAEHKAITKDLVLARLDQLGAQLKQLATPIWVVGEDGKAKLLQSKEETEAEVKKLQGEVAKYKGILASLA